MKSNKKLIMLNNNNNNQNLNSVLLSFSGLVIIINQGGWLFSLNPKLAWQLKALLSVLYLKEL